MHFPSLLALSCTLGLLPSSAYAQGGQDGGQIRPPEIEEGEGQGQIQPDGRGGPGNKPGNAVEPWSRTLENGLRVVIMRDATPGLVAVQTWISVGSGGESEAGATGYAHFFEHLMFHGTPTLSGDAREARLVALGVEENAWTSQDETCYHLLGPAQDLEDLLEIEADRFANLTLTEEGVRREAGAVYGEFRNSEADPYNALWLSLWSTAFKVHPYKHDTLGIEADIRAMPTGLKRAQRFRSQHYRPDNAMLMVVGDVDPAKAMAMVEQTYGEWSKAGPGPVAVPPEPAQTKQRATHIDWKGPAIDPKMAVGWRVPAFVSGQKESAALDVVRELLMARASRLARKLVDESDLVYSIKSAAPERVEPGLLYMFIDLKQKTDPAAVLVEIDAALKDLEGVSEGRVATARRRVQRRMQIALTGPEERALAVGRAALHGKGVSAYSDHVRALGTVDVAAVQKVIRTLLTPQRRTVVTLSGADK
jgi:zinc protease